MTDMSAPSAAGFKPRRLDTTSSAAQARIRARYRSEYRFRAYGIIALVITTTFVVLLLSDIVRRGVPAFFQHNAVLSVSLPKEAFGAGDAVGIKGADYFPITKAALQTAIPGIESRSGERALTRLLSSGTADILRETIVADPKLIGTTFKAPLLLGADADLYLKGEGTAITKDVPRGIATPSGTTGEVTVLTSSNDFAEELAVIKRSLLDLARSSELELGRLKRSGDKANAPRIVELEAEIADLRKRADEPGGQEVLTSKLPSILVEINGGLVKATKLSATGITGDVLLPLSSVAEAQPAKWNVVTYTTAESSRKVDDLTVAYIERLKSQGAIENVFNWRFFSVGDSREPELAGIRGALLGSALTMFVTLILCLPIGVAAAIYLEEFAPKNRLTDLIEVNINNLAAVPSIVFGLLGLAVFLNYFGFPRSTALVGGLVLALLVLPTIIIASRAALRSVPPSIKEAALGVGASKQQAIFHHVLPVAMPGIMTGTIIGMAHALGETAPLLMIGMIAFIVDVPGSLVDAATVLPVQIFLWADLPEPAFKSKTAGAIMVLLAFLFVMNGLAIWLRKRFERRW